MTNIRWYGNADNQILIDERSGRVLATIQHDGYGKHAVTVFPSLFSGAFWRQLGHELATSWQLRDYPGSRWTVFRWLAEIELIGFHARIAMGDSKAQHSAAIRPYAEQLLDLAAAN